MRKATTYVLPLLPRQDWDSRKVRVERGPSRMHGGLEHKDASGEVSLRPVLDASPLPKPPLESMYDVPLPAGRTGALYNAFSYPTKISPEAIALFIATHTRS